MVAGILVFLGSALLVDLVGYWLHRMIHQKWSGPMYRAHMTHHLVNYPPHHLLTDGYRSAGADSLALWFSPFFGLYVVLYVCLIGFHPWCAIAGALTSAGASSWLHDLTHIRGSWIWTRFGWSKGLGIRHHGHHYKMGRNFGIVVDWWDRLFRTRGQRLGAAYQEALRHRIQARRGRPTDGP